MFLVLLLFFTIYPNNYKANLKDRDEKQANMNKKEHQKLKNTQAINMILRVVLSQLTNKGHEASMIRSNILLTSMPLAISIVELKMSKTNSATSFVVTFKAVSEKLSSEGVEVLVVGFGPDTSTAINSVVEQWVLGVFPVLNAYILNVEVDNVVVQPMVIGAKDNSFSYGWTLYLGPIITRRYGGKGILENLQHMVIHNEIFDITMFTNKKLRWLECYAVRYADGKVDATCRKNNEDWQKGQSDLMKWASTWPEEQYVFLSRRQFLIFKPTPVNEISSPQDIKEEIQKNH